MGLQFVQMKVRPAAKDQGKQQEGLHPFQARAEAHMWPRAE
jgi:hypothetical protein